MTIKPGFGHYLVIALLALLGWQQFELTGQQKQRLQAEQRLERHQATAAENDAKFNELLAAERLRGHQLAIALQDEHQARVRTEQALARQARQLEQAQAQLEDLKHADPDSKSWSAGAVPAGIDRLLQQQYRAYQGGDQNGLPAAAAP